MMLGDKTKADARHLEWEAKGKIWHVNGCQYVDKAKLPMLSDDLGWVALVIMLRHNIQNTFHFTAVLLREKVIGRPTDRRTKILLKISFKYRLPPPPSQKREGGKITQPLRPVQISPKRESRKIIPVTRQEAFRQWVIAVRRASASLSAFLIQHSVMLMI